MFAEVAFLTISYRLLICCQKGFPETPPPYAPEITLGCFNYGESSRLFNLLNFPTVQYVFDHHLCTTSLFTHIRTGVHLLSAVQCQVCLDLEKQVRITHGIRPKDLKIESEHGIT